MEAEGSLFEVCGERHQREGRETSRARGDTGRATLCSGPPGPPSPHPTLPHPPALLHPPSCGGLAIGLSHLIMGLGLRVRAWPRCPLGIPRGMSGFWPHLGNRVAFPCGAYSYNLPVSQKTCPGSSQPHFWGPEVAPNSSSFSIPALVLICLSLDPEYPPLSRFPTPAQAGDSRTLAAGGYPKMTSNHPLPQVSRSAGQLRGTTKRRFLQRTLLCSLPLLPVPEFYTPLSQKVLLVVSSMSCMLPLMSGQGQWTSAQWA